MPDTISAADIVAAANGAAEVSVDGQSVKAVSLADLIEAKVLLDNIAPTTPKTGWARVRMGRAIPPGATGG